MIRKNTGFGRMLLDIERRRKYARFLLAFIFLGFVMKVAGEIIHEMGHAFFVLLLGGKILGINISVEWPFARSYTTWKLVDPTSAQLALIAVAGILFDTLTTVAGQFLLIRRQRSDMVYTLSLFWLSFWSYLNSVVYLVMSAFHPFGDILNLLNAIQVSRLWMGTLGVILLVVYTYSLSIILKDIFVRLLGLVHASEMVSIFWALLHLFFVSITVMKYGLPTPPTISGAVLVLIFIWSYISGRWLMIFISQLSGVGEGFELTRISGSKIRDLVAEEEDKTKRIKIGYAVLFSVALISAIITGLMVSQYVSTYSLIMKTDIEVEATKFELDFEKPVLNLYISIYNPTRYNLTLRRIEFDVKLNEKYMTHETLREIPPAPPEGGVNFVHIIILPLERNFTIEQALNEGEWDWTVQGSGYVDTLFGETLLRFKCKSSVEPE